MIPISTPGTPASALITSITARVRAEKLLSAGSGGSVWLIDCETSTMNKILTGNSTASGDSVQKLPRISAMLSTGGGGGSGTRSSVESVQAAARAASASAKRFIP